VKIAFSKRVFWVQAALSNSYPANTNLAVLTDQIS